MSSPRKAKRKTSKVRRAVKASLPKRANTPIPPQVDDPLLRKSVVARDYRGCTTRHLSNLIEQGDWPPPDIKATRLGEADLYFRSTAERARAEFMKQRNARAKARGDLPLSAG